MNAEVNESLQSSTLAQRLSRRLVESPGVINLRQLPTQRAQSAANTIIERFTLSDRLQSRYSSVGIFQPTVSANLLQRSRIEAFNTPDTPLRVSSGRGNGEWQRESGKWGDGEVNSSLTSLTPSPPPGTFRVSRRLSPVATQADSKPFSTETGFGSPPIQSSGDISASDEVPVSTPIPDASAAPPPSTEAGTTSAPLSLGEPVRVRHPSRSNMSIQRASIPQSDRSDNPMGISDSSIQSYGSSSEPLQRVSLPESDRSDTPLGTSNSSTQSQGLLDMPLQRVSLPESDRPTHPNAKAVSHEPTSPFTSSGNVVNEATATPPVTLIHRQSESASVMRVARKLDLKASPDSPIADVSLPSIPVNLENVALGQTLAPTPLGPMPLVVARVSLAQGTAEPSDTLEQKRSPLPIRLPATPSPPLRVQRQPQKGSTLLTGAQINGLSAGSPNAAESNNHPPKVSATISASGTSTTGPEMVWRNPTAESAPPLSPIRETSNSSAIARQTLSEPSPALEPVPTASSTSVTPTAEATTTNGTNNIDIQQIAQQVSRILTRQLTVERERRGIGKW